MKPTWTIILGCILLVARLVAARRGSPEETSFCYGTFPPGMPIPPLFCPQTVCLSIPLLVSDGLPTLDDLPRN